MQTNLKDKDVTLYIITKCTSCKKIQRVFISEDLDKRNTDPTKMYVTIKGLERYWRIAKTELPDIMSEQLLILLIACRPGYYRQSAGKPCIGSGFFY